MSQNDGYELFTFSARENEDQNLGTVIRLQEQPYGNNSGNTSEENTA